MKKIVMLLSLLMLSGCIYTGYRPYSGNAILLPNNVYYGEDGYYYTSSYKEEINSIYTYDESNKCVETFDDCDIHIIDNNISILRNEDSTTKHSIKLSDNDIEREKYNIDFNELISEDYGNYTVFYNDKKITNIKAYSKCLDSECCQKYIENGKLYFATMNFNRILRNREYSENRWDDDYINSDLYSVNLENNIISHIYSTDKNYVILYGNDKCVYLIDKNNSIYCYNLVNGQTIEIISTDYVGWTIAPYSHNKIFVNQGNNINIINVNE